MMPIPDATDRSTARLAEYARLARSLVANDTRNALAALSQVADDPAFVETARRHHLISLLWTTIAEADLRALIPPPALAALRAWLRRPRPSPEQNLRTIAEVQAAFARDGIEWMLLKGLYFADRLYGGLERRPQYDVDLFARRRDFRRAGRTLRGLGFVERWRDLHSATWTRDAANVDLHACFRNTPAYHPDERRIWRDRILYAIAGVSFATPSDEDTLVLLALSLFQDVGLGAAKLKQLLDVHLLAASIDERFDWTAFFARRRSEGTLATTVNVLDLALRVFAAEAELPRLAAALAPHRGLIVVSARDEALGLVFAPRGTAANKGWFFRVYPGSVVWYWLWLVPRKLSTYVRGTAPKRGPSSMRPTLATLRLVLSARTTASTGGRARP
jgi:hypothetical protein